MPAIGKNFGQTDFFAAMAGLILSLTFVFQNHITIAEVEGYLEGEVSRSMLLLMFAAPVATVISALHGGTLRAFGIDRFAVVGNYRIIFNQILPGMLLSVAILFVAIMALIQHPVLEINLPIVALAFASLAVLYLHANVGISIGLHLDRAIAIPAALVFPYFWLGFSWSIPFTPLRYFTGMGNALCCSIAEMLPVNAVFATILFNLGIGTAILVLSTLGLGFGGKRNARTAFALAVAPVTVLASLALTSDLGAQPGIPRSPIECAGSNPRICLFPEVSKGNELRQILSDSYGRLKAQGFVLPRTISQNLTEQAGESLVLVADPRMSIEQIQWSFARSILPASGPAFCSDEAHFDDNIRTLSIAQAWLYQTLSGSHSLPAEIRGNSKVTDSLYKLQSAHPVAQLNWVMTVTESISSCSQVEFPLP